jgi:hypothetical protein
LAKLRARTPLGSTDLPKGLQSAIKSFDPEATRPRCVVYIGDGASRAKWMGPEQVRPLVEQLRAERVTVSSLAIGPQRNVLMLSTLANQTGGVVLVDSDEVPSSMAGNQLALSAQAIVYWPTGSGDAEFYRRGLSLASSLRSAATATRLSSGN